MKLSIYIATRNGSSRNPPGAFAQLLQSFRDVADELVVLVDDTTDDDTREVACSYTKNVHSFVHDPLFIEMQRQAFYRCTGDWIFSGDDDDRLSSRWTRPVFEQLMNNRSVTHYWVPTRYLVNDTSYLSTAPYIGHFSPQLYRNIESIAVLPTNLHQQMAVAGEPAYLAGLYTDAMNFAWHDRASREAKLQMYDQAHDEAATSFDQTRFYLYEDYYFETERIDDAAMPAVMQPVPIQSPGRGISMRFLKAPSEMTVGQTYWVTVRIVNNSDRALLPQSEFIRWGELALGDRWLPAVAQAGASPLRTPFPARLLPGHQHDALVRVRAPDAPGTRRLTIDILQHERTWFSETGDGGAFETRDVNVRALVWPPKLDARPDRG